MAKNNMSHNGRRFSLFLFALLVNIAVAKSQQTPYKNLQENLSKGWNTWNINSVLSHVYLPSAFALNLGVKEYEEGFYLKESLIGRLGGKADDNTPGLISLFGEGNEQVLPGPRSYDGSYTELDLRWRGIVLKIQSAAGGDTLVVLVTPIKSQLKTPLLIVEGGMLWGNPGYVTKENNQLIGHFGDKVLSVYTNKPSINEVNINANTSYLSIPLNEQIVISTVRLTNEKALSYVNAHKEKVIAQEESFGELKEVYQPLHRILAWNTIYDPENKRVISPVSRNWKWGGFVLFNWDTYFAAYMYSVDSKELAYANAVEVTHGITPAGFIPNFSAGRGLKSLDRSQPPIGSFVVRELYRKYKDKWLLEEVYNELLTWNRWWFNNRMNESLLSWGSTPYTPVTGNVNEYHGINRSQGGGYESGLDNSPMYENMPFDTIKHVMQLNPVDLNSFYLLDCEALSDIARILGKTNDVKEIGQRLSSIKNNFSRLWNEKTGIYCNYLTDTKESFLRYTPTSFYPLFTGVPTQAQAKRMMDKHYFNPKEFYGEWMIPSLPRTDLAFPENNYLKGRTWPPLNFLVYLGIRKYDLPEARKDLVQKSKNLLLKEWIEKGHIHECYNSTTGEGCDVLNSDRFYHWGALLGMIVLMENGIVPSPDKPVSK